MRILRPLILTIVGVALIFGGVVTMPSSGDQVKCGSQVMEPGDTCTKSGRRSGTSHRTYEEQRDSNKNTAWALLGFGAVLSLGGGIWFIVALSTSGGRRAPHPPPYRGQPYGGAPYPPPPYPYPPAPQQPMYGYPPRQYGPPPAYPPPPGYPPRY